MDNIFLEGNSERRAFFDRLIFNFDPEHANRLAVYENAMRERIRLLKDNVNDKIWLGTLEQRMSEYGIAIAAARNDLLQYLQDAVNKAATSFPKPQFELRSKYENMLLENSALTVEDALKLDLLSSRHDDARNGRTNHGVHKADFHVVNTAKNIPASLCSTGEQKALLLSTILGLARLLREKRNRTPILLLDEVVSHLDETRRHELLAEISALGCQSFLTGTDAELFGGVRNFNYIAI
jgi:DNA replication and repair protein RecF